MGRKALVSNGLVLAFKQLGDLKERAEFVSTVSTFDPSTLGTTDVNTSVFASVVPFDKETKSKEGASASRLQLLVRGREVPSLAPYTTVRFRGKTWRIGNVVVDSGYILQFEVYLE